MSSLNATIYLPDRVMQNMETIGRMRTLVAVVGGIMAGIMGLTGIVGFVYFVICGAMGSFLIDHVACSGQADEYLPNGKKDMYSFGNVTSSVLTYILAWMTFYDAIYVF